MKWIWSLGTCKPRAFTEKGVAEDSIINPLKRSWFTMSKLSNSPVNTRSCYPAHTYTHLKCILLPSSLLLSCGFFTSFKSHPNDSANRLQMCHAGYPQNPFSAARMLNQSNPTHWGCHWQAQQVCNTLSGIKERKKETI